MSLIEFAIQSPEFQDEATLFSLSTEYLEAATVLYHTAPTRFNYSVVTFYLVGHAAQPKVDPSVKTILGEV